jgi:phosphomannomutase
MFKSFAPEIINCSEIRKLFSGPGMGVFADIKSNPLAIMEMAKCGVTVDVMRNGHSQIKDALYADASKIGCVEESAHFYEAFTYEGRRYCTENTLYIALLAARLWKEHPERFNGLIDLQARTAREREWGYTFSSDESRVMALDAVQRHFESKGATAVSRTPGGYDLESTMMRRGIPFAIDAGAVMSPDWLQVCQRISQSENGLARWETVAATSEIAAQAKREIAEIVRQFGASEEYKG